ncbi:hypothetical protein [Clostridium sp. HBUAS56017]|uniref:hypothetical protein n=1 Tax=Clostridium sp. HBUAS56017 TaxID=2571128 RepID=UPI001178C7CE|nr:hypothetical protein [Clostridium sp. HBUAS56017]
MKNKICLILVFLFSFFSESVYSYGKQNEGIINVESRICKTCDFTQNGVMARYNTNNSKQEEIKKIVKNINKNFANANCNVMEDEISSRTSTFDIQASIWEENNKTMVEIKIINYNKDSNLGFLMKELTKLQTKNIFHIRYFQYIKGKIKNIEETIDNIKNIQEITNINTLAIHNGYVGTGYIYNGERVNFAVSSYDTGSYLIIGTPVIFATY